jgi:hypothetical protein
MSKLIRKKASDIPVTAFVTSSPSVLTTRNDATLNVGFELTVGSTGITVTQLGRWVISGNSGTHTLAIYDASCALVVSTTINTSGLSVGYNYVSITPTVLSASTVYYIMSSETASGDLWYDNETYTSTADGTITHSAFSTCNANNSTGYSYVPVNFKYYLNN